MTIGKPRITHYTQMPFIPSGGLTSFAEAEQVHLFKDCGEGGFEFKRPIWKEAVRAGDWSYILPEAIAHRDEAIRRMVICRLLGHAKEAEHWFAHMRYFENAFKLKAHDV